MYFNLQWNCLFLSLKISFMYNTNLLFHKCFYRVVQEPIQVGMLHQVSHKKKTLMPESLWAENISCYGKGFLDMSGEVGTIQNYLPSSEKPIFESQPLDYEILWGMKKKCVSKAILPTERKQNLWHRNQQSCVWWWDLQFISSAHMNKYHFSQWEFL